MSLGNRTEDNETGKVHKTINHLFTLCGKRITGKWLVGSPLYDDKKNDLCEKCFSNKEEDYSLSD